MGGCPLFVFQGLHKPAVNVRHEDHLGQIRSIAERVARGYGLEIFDVQLRREPIGWVLRVIIDRPEPDGPSAYAPAALREDSVTIADCQQVSQDVSAILDVEDAVDHAYTLEVSSPGLDRPLRHAGDYRRFTGRLAKIVMSETADGPKHVAGRIKGVEDDVIVVEEGRRTHRIPLPLIARARLKVEF